MSRIRTVKPELFKHEELFEAEERYQLPLRLVFIGLFTCCDREGRFRWQPRRLKLDILPYDQVEMPLILDALAEAGFIVAYDVKGVVYGQIPTWPKHQCINNKESKSQIPDIQQGIVLTAPIDQAYVERDRPTTRELHAPLSAASPVNFARRTEESLDPIAAALSRKSIHSHTKMTLNEGGEPLSVPEAQRGLGESKTTDRQSLNTYKNREFLPSPHTLATRELRDENGALFSLNQHEGKGKEREYGREEGKEPEREKEGCGKEKPSPKNSPSESALTIFAYWQRVMNHPKAVLDKSRQKCIRNALAMGYDVTALCQAIQGCSCTPHNIGQNDRGERYDGLHVIFKSADQIDRFIRNANNPPRPMGKSDQRLQRNVDAAQRWLNQSHATQEAAHGNNG